MRRWAAYYLGCVYYEWNELSRAEEVLEPIVRQAPRASGIAFANASCVLAATYQAQGRMTDARVLLTAAVDFSRARLIVDLPLLNAFAAELALRQGDVSGAAQWIVQQNTPIPGAPAFHFFAPQLTHPKVLLALNLPAARQEAARLCVRRGAGLFCWPPSHPLPD